MIELTDNRLTFRFPQVHREARCNIDFQRTLRIPDDNRDYPLPPGLGRFPVEHVDDYADTLPAQWQLHGGVFLPLYQSEALWINFSGRYPCAIKIAAGKINAVSGEQWTDTLGADPQDYVVVPEQPWLDGFNVSAGHIRQFVAMPLGEGFTAEEQLTGKAEHGGLQIVVYPMKHDAWKDYSRQSQRAELDFLAAPTFCQSVCESVDEEMGLAPGGLMKQVIYDDEFGIDAWDMDHGSRCFVHLVNSRVHATITGHPPPHEPPTAKDYDTAGLPWFDYYSEAAALPGAAPLSGLTSVAAMSMTKSGKPLSENDPVQPKVIHTLGEARTVRGGEF